LSAHPARLGPSLKIGSNSRDPTTALTTDHTFLTTEQALEFGQDMAHEWIDGHFKEGADRLDEVGENKTKTLT
jgi:hypothetical protein